MFSFSHVMLISEHMHYLRNVFIKTLKPDVYVGSLRSAQAEEFCHFSPHSDCNCKHLQSIRPSLRPFKETINHNSKREASHYIQSPCVLFLSWRLCIIFFPPERGQEVRKPVIMCSFSSLRSEVWVFLKLELCSGVCGLYRMEWMLDSDVWGQEIINVCVDPPHSPQIRRTFSHPFHYLFKGFGTNCKIVCICN